MRHLPLVVLTCAALSLAACGDSDSADQKTPAAPKAAGQDLAAIKTYLLEHTQRLKADGAKLRPTPTRTTRWPSASTSTTALLNEHRGRSRSCSSTAKKHLRRGQPGLRGDGGRRRRGPRARRLRRDHRRRRRRLGSRERRAVLDQDRGRHDLQAAGQLLLPRRDLAVGHRAEVRGQGRADLDGDGKVEFGEALPDAALLPRGRRRGSTSRPPSSTPPPRSGRRPSRTPSPRSS